MDVFLKLCGLLPATRGERVVVSDFGQPGELVEHVEEEKLEPHALAFAFRTNLVHMRPLGTRMFA